MEFEFDNAGEGGSDDQGNWPEPSEDFDAAVELDESMLNFPATGLYGNETSGQFYSRMAPVKKAFSVMKLKK